MKVNIFCSFFFFQKIASVLRHSAVEMTKGNTDQKIHQIKVYHDPLYYDRKMAGRT